MAIWAWILIIVVLIALGGLALRQRRAAALRQRFGPEYERAVEVQEDRRAAEAALREREKQHALLDIRPLPEDTRARFAREWLDLQEHFVDEPSDAVMAADRLVGIVMDARGYPMGDFDTQADLVSVDHPQVVENYRIAHGIHGRALAQQASTEDLRDALLRYRSLFDELLRASDDEAARRLPALQAHGLGDDRLHDLAGAAVDAVDPVVGVQAGDRVLVHVAVAAVQLQAAVDDAAGDLGAEQLGRGGVGGGQLAARRGPPARGRPRPGRRRPRPCRRPARTWCSGRTRRACRRPCGPGRTPWRTRTAAGGLGVGADGDAEALLRQVLAQVGEALALLAEQVLDGHLDVGEGQLGGVGGLQAELVELAADRVALGLGVDDEEGDAVAAVVLAVAGEVRAQTITRSAWTPPVMKVLAPLST